MSAFVSSQLETGHRRFGGCVVGLRHRRGDQIDHRDQGAENDQDVKRIFKENHDIFPESSGPRIHISCRDGSGIKSRFIIESIHGRPWLCQYDRTRIQWGYFTRPDLVNMVGSWLIRFQRQAILEAAKGEVDRDEH